MSYSVICVVMAGFGVTALKTGCVLNASLGMEEHCGNYCGISRPSLVQ